MHVVKEILKNTDFYHLSKLSELGSPVVRDLEHIKKLHFKAVVTNVANFKKEAIKKYGSLDDMIGLQDTLEKIEFVFGKVNEYFNGKYDLMEARVMIYALNQLYEELISMAEEIDGDR